MTAKPPLRGCSVIVVGAGLAGLAAAVELRRSEAAVTVFEARDRTGGRVLTMRRGFAEAQHAEAGGDFIDEEHSEICRLVRAHGLTLAPVLRSGFGFVRSRHDGRVGPTIRGDKLWNQLAKALHPFLQGYRWSEERWDGAVAKQLSSLSVADWMKQTPLHPNVSSMLLGLRGFFLGDPPDVSLLTLVDQIASGTPGKGRMYRIRGGNDALPSALAAELRDRVRLRHEVLAVRQKERGVLVTVRMASGDEKQVQADYVILTMPAGRLRSLEFDPPLPSQQRAAITKLRYGPVTKTLLQFDHRFWRGRGRPLAYGTDLPTGAVWDGNEEQKGSHGILCLMAGGSASPATQELLAKGGPQELARQLHWMGASRGTLLAIETVSWEQDPWAGGGYALFGPQYDAALRQWLARPFGRILFAGEHTSLRWQGYMNGAVESGLRAAAEVHALNSLRRERRGTNNPI
jgi:monoamine oxidase